MRGVPSRSAMLLRWYGAADGEDGGGEESGEVARMESRYISRRIIQRKCLFGAFELDRSPLPATL